MSVTKEYQDSSGVVYAKVTFNNAPTSDDEDRGEMEYQVNFGSDGFSILEKNPDNKLWSVKDFALRDLLIYLVQKYRIDEVYDSKIKAKNWENLIDEFHAMTENRVTITKPQIIRKWHNWKQYNKARKKPHPFVVCGPIALDLVLQKCSQLCEQARTDTEFAALLARGPIEAIDTQGSRARSMSETESPIEDLIAKKYNHGGIGRMLKRDFIVRKTGANATALSLKRLHHEIALEGLTFEQEKWRIKLENEKLINIKLQKEAEIMELKLEKAHMDLAIKKNQCLNLGIGI